MSEKTKSIPSLVKDPELVKVRRNQIIQAAMDLFVQKGFHKTTTREIARESGIGIGTLYEYIQSKEDVLYLVCDHIHSEVEQKLDEEMTHGRTGRETLVNSIGDFFRIMDQMQDSVLLIYQEMKSLPNEMLHYVLAKEELITSRFERILERGIEDGSLSLQPGYVKLTAHNIVVLGEMWAFRRWALSRHYSLEEYISHQTALVLHEMKSGR
ncbi:TetR/AcrR family transcriptional regulator [Effusibacillus dendaii]|uniref:TetR family transcriptional regulator n=1 Tax=Effusibacillus dendaii TaxID=2743772 RepID=A0A7I8D924_9BACL|nr:TetR/AcrR family transcriptional regulator [Effusibacillus dendaii]BCJ86585.1 TetR family transcriptional regulator [Effusibacillus dendaii]